MWGRWSPLASVDGDRPTVGSSSEGRELCQTGLMTEWMTYEEELREPLGRADWEQREIYAKFGLAIYFCQVLETGLVTYLGGLLRAKSRKPMTPDEVDLFLNGLFKKTLGQNIQKVRELFGPEARWILEKEMQDALRLRNQLAHHWMRERVLLQSNHENRLKMMDELDEAISTLQECNRVLTERTVRVMKAVGVPDEFIQGEYERLTALADRGEPDDDAPPYFTPRS